MSNDLTSSLDPDFAAAVAHRLVVDPEFFALFGVHMDADLCSEDSARWTVKAAQAIYRDANQAPGGEFAVMQRLQSWVDGGSCPAEILEAVEDDFDDQIDRKPIPSAVLAGELGNVLRESKRHRLVDDLIKAHGRGEDCLRQAKQLQEISRIGHAKTSSAVGLSDAHSLLLQASKMERHPTGIEELDDGMKGGPPRQSLTLWIGGTGDGKSIALSMVSAVALLNQRSVVYVSLEIPRYMVLARISAALTGYLIDDFEAVDPEALEALDRMRGNLGSLAIEYMEPGVTTPGDIDDLIESVQQARGEPVEFLAVDYLDRLAAPGKRGSRRGEISTYSTGEIVTTQLRDQIIVPRNLWGHTASAAKGQDKKKKVKGTDDGADSLHKARISDNVITLNVDEMAAGERQLLFKLAKHRTGRAGFTVGPHPAEFEYGRLIRSASLDAGVSQPLWSSVF
jgi:hypothetical protein